MTDQKLRVEDVLPLSPLQEGFLFHSVFDRQDSDDVYTIQYRVGLEGDVEPDRMERAVAALVQQHGNLRVAFRQKKTGETVQVVAKQVPTPFRFVEGTEGGAIDAAAQEDRAPFTLYKPPLMRLTLVRSGEGQYTLIFTAHHILLDGWSLPVMFAELFERYSADGGPIDRPAPTPYKDYLSWLTARDGQADKACWRSVFEGLTDATLVAPGDGGFRPLYPETQLITLSEEFTSRLKDFCQEREVTLNSAVRVAWSMVVGQMTGRDDVVVGATVSGRPPDLPGVEAMIGLFINTIPMRVRLDPTVRVSEVVTQAHNDSVQVLDHQYARLSDIRRYADVGELFDTLMVFENYPLDPATISLPGSGLTVRSIEGHDATHYPLTLVAIPGDCLTLRLDHRPDLFTGEQAAVLLGRVESVLHTFVETPEQRLADLSLTTEQERADLVKWDGRTVEPVEPRRFEALFEGVVESTPEAECLVHGDHTWTYIEVDRITNRLARTMASYGAGPETVVALQMPRSVHLVMAALAALKAGAAYLPIDPEYPTERITYMLEDSAPVLVFASSDTYIPGDFEVLRVDFTATPDAMAKDVTDEPINDGQARLLDHPAYVIYTSGTTGHPKGVVLTHRGVRSFALAICERVAAGGGDRVLQFASPSFDASVLEMVLAWGAGAALVVPTVTPLVGEVLSRELKQGKVTHALIPPVVLGSLDVGEQPASLVVGGDVTSTELVAAWAPNRRMINAYGPTESTVVTSMGAPLESDSSAPTIGTPIPGTQVRVLDRYLRPVGVGVAGDLYIAGNGLARGYHDRPDLTSERFVADPQGPAGSRMYRSGDIVSWTPHGELQFLGRSDAQVKVRGFRIELGEIEAVLEQVTSVRQAVVVVRDDAVGARRIVAYVVRESGPTGETTDLRDHAASVLPEYMVPAAFVELEAIPLTMNGSKVDRRALPEPSVSPRETGRAPKSEAEEVFIRVFEDVLDLNGIGVDDSFFELGGDSIMSIQLVSRARKEGFRLSPKDVFLQRTPAALAAAASPVTESPTGAGDGIGEVPLTPIVHWLRELGGPIAQFHQSMVIQVPAEADDDVLQAALDALIERHDALRLQLNRSDDIAPWRLYVRERGSVHAADLLRSVKVEAGADLDAILEREHGTEATRLDPDAGVVFRAVHLDAGDQPGRLLLLIHHLSVDGVSWRILLPDLAVAGEAAIKGDSIDLEPVGTSLRSWATALLEEAQSTTRTSDLSRWIEIARPVDTIAERPLDPSTDVVDILRKHECHIPARIVQPLLGPVPSLFHAEIDHILLTALALALASWRRSKARPDSPSVVALERHGRDATFGDADLSRTVGWFTAMHPVRLDVSGVDLDAALAGGPEIGVALKRVKESLYGVPDGIGYGLLRHLNIQTSTALARLGEPEIGFNYLGRFTASDGRPWGAVPETSGLGGGTDQGARVPHVLEINAWSEDTADGPEMTATWSWPEGVLSEGDVRCLMGAWSKALTAIVSYAENPEAGGRTPSDVPLIAIDQAGLDWLEATVPGKSDLLPLTPMQEGLLFHSLYDTDEDVYTVQLTVDVLGPLDANVLREAARTVIARHAALRSGFIQEVLPTPVAFMPPELDVPWREIEVVGSEEAEAIIAAEKAAPFDLSKPPLVRFLLVRHAPDKATFVMTNHHILFDGWSMPIVVGDLLRAYSGVKLPPSIGAEGYHQWKAEQDHEASRVAWARVLDGVEGATLLAGPVPSETTPVHERIEVVLAAKTTGSLREIGRRLGVTLNTLVQACWGLLLTCMTGRRDVVFGATTSGRPGELAGVESMVGLFINTLPVRVHFEPEDTLEDVLVRLQRQQAELLDHQSLSLTEVQDIVGAGELFDTITVFENYPLDAEQELPGGVRLVNPRVDDATHYPMALVAMPGEQLSLSFIHRTDVIDSGAAKRIAERMEALLEAVCDDSSTPVRHLDLLTEEERTEILTARQGAAPVTSDVAPTLLARFTDVVAQHADEVALTGIDTMTYAELDARSNRLAHRLIALGVGLEDKVAVLQERSQDLVVATLAIVKAGAAYVPMDARSPRSRLEHVLSVTEPMVLLADEHHLDDGLEHEIPVLRIEDGLEEMLDSAPDVHVDPENLAYVMFTSGSTGTPKGVAVTHRNIVDLALDASFDGGNFTQVLMHSPHAFDASTFEIWVPLLLGGRIIVAPPGELDIDDLASVILMSGVTGLWLTSGLFRVLIEEHPECFANVAEVWSGGDIVPAGLARDLLNRNPQLRLGDGYGPTETTTFATRYIVDDATEVGTSLPIGTPLDGTCVYVLDDLLRPVPLGVPGELFIGGAGLSRGYFGRPDLTSERFVANPFGDGDRLYRTGDLVCWRTDPMGHQAIAFLGRKDEQVKIRGFRIELGEIEAVVAARTGVGQAAVVVRETRPGDKRLVAYVTPVESVKLNKAALREEIAAELPEFMVPSTFVVLDDLPLTWNKKIDRRALPDIEDNESNFREPTTDFERTLCDLFAGVLGRDRIGVDDDFFSLGGHSLLATRLVSRVRTELDAEVPIRALFESPTPAMLAAQIANASKARLSLQPYDRPERIPASFGQRRIWFIEQLEGTDSPYKIPIGLRVSGEFDLDAFEAALGDVAAKHEVLRTIFAEADGSPVQVVLPIEKARPRLKRLQAKENEAVALLMAETANGFDLATEPPLRALSVQVGPEEYRVLLLVHHIAADGWSMAPMGQDLSTAYQARIQGHAPELRPLPVQYADYSLWQQEIMGDEDDPDSEIARQVAYWRDNLDGIPDELTLPTDRPRPDRLVRGGGVIGFDVDPDLHTRIVEVAQESQTSPFMVLQAALAATLSRMGAGTDIPIGSPIAGRGDDALDDLIGFFVNTLVLRTDTSGDPTFTELLARVREVVLEAYAHQDLPFERLVEIMQPDRSESRNPLFQVLLVLQNNSETTLEMPGVDVTVEPVGVHASQFDLSFDFTERFLRGCPDGMTGRFDFSKDLFDDAGAQAVLDRFLRLLRGVLMDPDTHLGDIDILGEEERGRLLHEFTDTAAPEGPVDIVDIVRGYAEDQPDRPALVDEDGVVTYRQLARRAGALSARLLTVDAQPGDVAAVLAQRSVHIPTALLGILGAGAAYTPLSPTAPTSRNAAMLADSGARWIITDPASQSTAEDLVVGTDVEVICLDHEEAAGMPPLAGRPEDLAYIIFTSGSTGRPKGAMVHRRGMANHLLAKVDILRLTDEDMIVANAPLSFDISIWQMLAALVIGGTIRVVDDETAMDAEALFKLAEKENVTILEVVPSLLRTVLDVWGPDRPVLDGLRNLVVTGEALPAPLCQRWLELYPHVPLVNAYGPTECSDDVAHAVIDASTDLGIRVPIGRAVRNTRLYVVDDMLEPVPLGVTGELCVGGIGVGYGYIADPVKTARAFVPDPFATVPGERLYRTGDRARFRPDGTLEFLGREDHQVKIRGQRIELGEVELALHQIPGVSDAVVTVTSEAGGQNRLIGYVVGDVDVDAVRRDLSSLLPRPMIPAAIVAIPTFPLTHNGKVDRKALPEPDLGAHAGRGPRTTMERTLCMAFSDVLGVPDVGIDDNFFDLGGHSLLVTRLVNRLRGLLGVDVPVRLVFTDPTVEGIAAHIDESDRSGCAPAAVDRPSEIPVSFEQKRLWFINQMEDAGTYNVPIVLRIDGDLDAGIFVAALYDVVERHESLRTVFPSVDGVPIQRIRDAEDGRPEITVKHVPSERIDAVIEDFVRRGFDLLEETPIRAAILHDFEDPSVHHVVVVIHHIASDFGSAAPLNRDLADAYLARNQGRAPSWDPLPVQYADYTLWQADRMGEESDPESVISRQLAYWTEVLADLPKSLELPVDRPRPAETDFAAGVVGVDLEAELHARLDELARQHHVSLAMVLQAAFAALLYRLGAGTDIPLGVPVAGRSDEALEDLVGFFVNTLVLRTDVSGNPTFTELLDRVKKSNLEAFAHQDTPFERIVEVLNPTRSLTMHPLVQVVFSFQNHMPTTMEIPGLTVTGRPVPPAGAKYDLSVKIAEDRSESGMPTGITGWIEYRKDLFDAASVELIVQRFGRLLRAFADDPEAPVGDPDILIEGERHRLLIEWNDTATGDPRLLAHEFVERQASLTPELLAISDGETGLTYGELNARANCFARGLISRGVGVGDIVAVALPRSIDLIVALLAVLKTGAAYAPVDPEYPVDRIERMLDGAGAFVTVTRQDVRIALPERFPVALVEDMEGETLLGNITNSERRRPVNLHDAAYVIFTSGSTGMPKGVVIEHYSFSDYLVFAAEGYEGVHGLALLHSSISFDLSVTSMWVPLVVGGAVLLTSFEDVDPRIVESLRDRSVNFVKATPSHLPLLSVLPEEYSPSHELLLGGERLLGSMIEPFRAKHPQVTLFNMYGPTETTVNCTQFRIPPGFHIDEGTLPIGSPLPNTRCYVLDEHLGVLPTGVAGELYVAGNCLARGYLGRPDITARKFVADPFGEPGDRMYRTGDIVRWNADGTLSFLRRIDDQIQLRGFRVELGEVESALTSYPGVSRAAAVLREDHPGDLRLVAYVTSNGKVSGADVMTFVAGRLPEYMVPSAVVVLDELPMTPNRKVDRSALPAPVADSSADPPRTQRERVVANLFAEILGVPSVGIHDSFFDLGGHSLLATRIIARLQKIFGTQLTLRSLFEAPTAARLAARVEGDEDDPFEVLLPLRRHGEKTPLFCIHPASGFGWSYGGLLQHLPPGVPLYALQSQGLNGESGLPCSVEEVAQHYVAKIREVQPHGPYRLLGWSFGGLIAHDVTRILEESGERVALLAMLDSFPKTEIDRTQDLLQIDEREFFHAMLDLAGYSDVLGKIDETRTSESIELSSLVELLREEGGVFGDITESQLSAIYDVFVNNSALARDFRPGEVEADVVLYVATKDVVAPEPETAWDAHVGRLDRIDVEARHNDMTNPRQIAIIGADLITRLTEENS